MKSSLSITLVVIVTCVLLAVASWYYLFSRINASPQKGQVSFSNNDSLRTHAVNDIATKLSFLKSSDQITLASLPEEWQQIGTSTEGCEIVSQHCQITIVSCFDMQSLSEGKFTIPTDVLHGTPEQTGFALRRVGKTLEIKACFSDKDQVITQQLRF